MNKRGWILFAVLCVTATDVWAAGKGARPCTAQDLVGTWEMKNISTKIKLRPDDAFGWPFQRFTFDAKGGVKQIASDKPLTLDKEVLRRFDNELTTSLYKVDGKGILHITKLESPEPERCVCSVATTDVPAQVLARVPEAKRDGIPAKGDVAFTYMSREGKPVLMKTLKKIA